ncbi:MAG: methionyl-tRNA formyltransferase [Candidatus Aminicenantes bacterium]|nr:methionyl-tRNA formyltransferase [Candidatus Aminicenantes bacterium]
MRIVFFGSPVTAIPSLLSLKEAGHEIKLVVTQPDSYSGRGRRSSLSPVKQVAVELNIPVFQPQKIRKDPEALKIIQEFNPDIIIVVAYGQIIPSSIIYLPPYNSWNLHFSLLPKYRGAAPVQWAILKGETTTGVTIFELNEKMDEGDILASRQVPLLPGEKAYELEARLASLGSKLLIQTLDIINTIKKIPQDHSEATYAPLLKKEDGRIDWDKTSFDLENQIRAFDPWPSSYTFIKNTRLKILEGENKCGVVQPCKPGQILSISREGIEVCCKDQSVFLIKRLQPENKLPMEAFAFSHGARLEVGDFFT